MNECIKRHATSNFFFNFKRDPFGQRKKGTILNKSYGGGFCAFAFEMGRQIQWFQLPTTHYKIYNKF